MLCISGRYLLVISYPARSSVPLMMTTVWEQFLLVQKPAGSWNPIVFSCRFVSSCVPSGNRLSSIGLIMKNLSVDSSNRAMISRAHSAHSRPSLQFCIARVKLIEVGGGMNVSQYRPV